MKRWMKMIMLTGIIGIIFCPWLIAADFPREIIMSDGIRMVLIPGGSFEMGGNGGKDEEKNVHRVTVDSFYMDVCEVTQKSFEAITGSNPSKFSNPKGPVERIRWTDAIKYCNARSLKDGLKPCYDLKTGACDFNADGYRLPTEAEWEYACRAGSGDEYFFKGGEAKLGLYAWYRNNSSEKVHAVGTKKPNAFGLFDMCGNVSEWCNDFYDKDYYAKSPVRNPSGPASGDKRVLRGGNWSSRPKDCKSFRRFADNPVTADICQGYDTYGFRCVRKVVVK